MRKLTSMLFAALLAFGCLRNDAAAQNKTLTLEDIVANAAALAPQNLPNLQWIKTTDHVSYSRNDTLFTYLVKGKKEEMLTTLKELNAKLPPQAQKIGRFPRIQWSGSNLFWFTHDGYVWQYHTTDKVFTLATPLLKNGTNTDRSAAGWLAQTQGSNLFVVSPEGTATAVTNDTAAGIVNGQAVHRNEFGITKGTFWSPAGKKLAFYRLDESMVAFYPLTNYSQAPAQVTQIRYPMAGGNSHHAQIAVYDTDKKTTVYLQTGEPKDQYLTNLCWSPDEQFIYVSVLHRDQHHLTVNRYSAATGALDKTLIQEISTKYIEPENPLYFMPNNPNQFVFFSEREGYQQLYLYQTDGTLLKKLTPALGKVTQILGLDAAGLNFYYMAVPHNSIETHIFKVNLKNYKTVQLSSTSGVHRAQLSGTGIYLIDEYSAPATPRNIQVIDAIKGQNMAQLFSAPNPLKDYRLGTTEVFNIKAADDSTLLFCRLVKPADFDSTRKYPVIVYVYGGPGIQLIQQNWLNGANLFFHYLAQQGYLVFTVDSRGSANRSTAFEQVTHQDLGTAECADQMKGLAHLRSLPYVDPQRIGVHGWSYGGFMTLSLMTRQPDAFKAGVAGGPVVDWRWYEIMYTERYMNTPQVNPDGYVHASVLNYVRNLKGRLLVIHGAQDDVVVWQHSLQFVQKCIDEGKIIDYFVYPQQPHNVSGKERIHLYKRITDYFDVHLK